MSSLRIRTVVQESGIADFYWNPRRSSKGFSSIPAPAPSYFPSGADVKPLTFPNLPDAEIVGEPAGPFLHLDIRTPFGESVTQDLVESALAEALGPAKKQYHLRAWHVLHFEDIHVGTNHRIWVDLADTTASERPHSNSADGIYPLPVALEALGEVIAGAEGQPHFQMVIPKGNDVWSLLYLNAQPFHLLRVTGTPQEISERLIEHHRYLLAQKRQAPESVCFYVPEGDSSLREADKDSEWVFRTWNSIFENHEGLLPGWKSPSSEKSAFTVIDAAWHAGILKAAQRDDFSDHNRAPFSQRRMRENLRRLKVVGIRCAWVLFFGAMGYAAFYFEGKEARAHYEDIRKAASTHASAVQNLGQLRLKRESVRDSLQALSVLAHSPINLARLARLVSETLPPQSAMDAWMLKPGTNGSAFHFRAFVPQWESVAPFQEALMATQLFSNVELTDQRKDPDQNRIYFQAVCTLVQ
jgi:hypothetical protein